MKGKVYEKTLRRRLGLIPYEAVPRETVKLPERRTKRRHDDPASLKGRPFVAERC